ncbi:hypothetical protein BTM25_24180 [Actinomadura rubteroloni]|uniref:Uncharacterized protein n=1 Tax=Actinomadura rubteroloni TaxID=1926885 RepID=A0A2P4UFF8_9ACTN|nr:hypothetical protein [Actinomadura rubteroloni]POM23793.1 hypothetical protein BTM25_24180 [Actinomadura rubteroloni]
MGEQPNPWHNPFQTLFRISLLVLGSAVALNVAITYLRLVVPWLLGAAGVAGVVWCVVAVVRWRKSQW